MARARSGATFRKIATPLLKSDIRDGIDCRDLPYDDGEVDCVVLDPPYMHTPGGTAHTSHTAFEHHYRNNGTGNRTVKKYHEAVLALYEEAGKEAFRVLRDRGVLIVKCQDEVCSNRQRFAHVEIMKFLRADRVHRRGPVRGRTAEPAGSESNGPANPCPEESLIFPSVLEADDGPEDLGRAGMNAVDLLVEIIREHSPEDIWRDSPFIRYRALGNTNRGEIGEEFVRRYLAAHGIKTGNGGRTARTDVRIEGLYFEVKTASLGANGTFQFNHVRLDRQYDYLLCLGICPERVVFNMWRKGAVAENRAGTLVRMAEGQAVTYKLTKKLADMEVIERLPGRIQTVLASAEEA